MKFIRYCLDIEKRHQVSDHWDCQLVHQRENGDHDTIRQVSIRRKLQHLHRHKGRINLSFEIGKKLGMF